MQLQSRTLFASTFKMFFPFWKSHFFFAALLYFQWCGRHLREVVTQLQRSTQAEAQRRAIQSSRLALVLPAHVVDVLTLGKLAFRTTLFWIANVPLHYKLLCTCRLHNSKHSGLITVVNYVDDFVQVMAKSGISCVPGTRSCRPPWRAWRCPQNAWTTTKNYGRLTAKLRSKFYAQCWNVHVEMSGSSDFDSDSLILMWLVRLY